MPKEKVERGAFPVPSNEDLRIPEAFRKDRAKREARVQAWIDRSRLSEVVANFPCQRPGVIALRRRLEAQG